MGMSVLGVCLMIKRHYIPVRFNYPLCSLIWVNLIQGGGGGGGGVLPIMTYYGEAPPKRGTFFMLQVYKRVGIHDSSRSI